MRLSHSQEPVDIAQYLQNLFDGPEERWPYVDTSNFMGDVLFADQPKIDLQVCILSIFLYSYFIFKIFLFLFLKRTFMIDNKHFFKYHMASTGWILWYLLAVQHSLGGYKTLGSYDQPLRNRNCFA